MTRNAILPTLYPSYETALADCGEGYSDIVLNAVRFFTAANVIEGLLGDGRTESVVPSTHETLKVFQSICLEPAHVYRVLDFGGGFALAWFFLRRRLPQQFRWAVVETPQTAALGKAFETEELRFFDTVDAARLWLGGVDVVHSNGALQYHPIPEAALESLVSLSAPQVVLLRCVLSRDARAIRIQESLLGRQLDFPLPAGVTDRPVRYVHTSMLVSDFDNLFAKAGYVLAESNNNVNNGNFRYVKVP